MESEQALDYGVKQGTFSPHGRHDALANSQEPWISFSLVGLNRPKDVHGFLFVGTFPPVSRVLDQNSLGSHSPEGERNMHIGIVRCTFVLGFPTASGAIDRHPLDSDAVYNGHQNVSCLVDCDL